MKKLILNLWATFTAWLSSPHFSKMLVDYLKKQATKVIRNFAIITFVDYLKKQATKVIIAKFLITGNLKLWLVKLLADYVFEKGDDKLVEPLFRKLGFSSNVSEGKITYEKLTDASTNDDWYDAADNV